MAVRFRRIGTDVPTDHSQLSGIGTRDHDEIDNYLAEIDTATEGYSSLDARLDMISSKTIVFYLPGIPALGAQLIEIRFPFVGTIAGVNASCVTPDTIDETHIQIEKCSYANYILVPSWVEVLSSPLIIDADKKVHSLLEPPVIGVGNVDINDFFRLYISEFGAGIRGLTVEITIIV